MNISQALRRIKQIKGEISSWSTRLATSVQWEGDNKPAYSLEECQAALDERRTELVSLRTRVALANATNFIEPAGIGRISLTESTIRLSEIKSEIAEQAQLRTHASAEWTTEREKYQGGNYITVEQQNHCDWTTRQRDEHVASLNEKFQSINALLEAANHTVEV
jgi:hypothetical protein